MRSGGTSAGGRARASTSRRTKVTIRADPLTTATAGSSWPVTRHPAGRSGRAPMLVSRTLVSPSAGSTWLM